MQQSVDLFGAIVASGVFLASILVFSARLFFRAPPGHWIGLLTLSMFFPLVYLLLRAREFDRPPLYYLQVGAMLLFILVLFLVDYYPGIEFRNSQRAVISFVVLYFAGLGGMIGLASLAGPVWTLSAVALFFITAVLAFVQRAVTGF